MSDVAQWLEALGLSQYGTAFAENDVDLEVLPELAESDLEGLGVSLGHRKKLLKAIAALPEDATASAEIVEALPSIAAPAPKRQHEAERRQLTVMFVDLVGSTELSGRLDPEEMRDVLRNYQNAVAGEVTRFDGSVAKYMGDGVLCYFGWPKAHEDDAERAVRAGMAIMQALQRATTGGDEVVRARAGVATGLVVVGDLIGEGAAQEEVVVGETPNLAARMQGVAQPNQVVVAETTRLLLGNVFELVDLGAQDLKGISGKTSAYVVSAERVTESRFEARSSGRVSAMVGRDHELALMRERWKQARAGEGQLVLLTGEAGIGKSRIARAMIDAVASEPHTRISYQCSPYHTDSSLYPAVQQLTFAAGIKATDSNDEKLDKLESVLMQGDTVLIAALLGLDGQVRYGRLDMTPQQQRARTLQVLADHLISLSRDKPVLFVLEDAHWIDASTLELLDLCLDQVASVRVLMLITARPAFEHGFGGHPIVTKLTLNRLGREQVTKIVDRITGGKTLPHELLDEIAKKTDGVPLFVEELTKAVLESGGLKETETAYELTGPISHLAIPATLHDSLMARLDRLQPVKEVAQTAACIGREFAHALLAVITPLNDAALQDALKQLIVAELIFRRCIAGETSYIFKHALVRDAAYESLLRTRRQAIHAKLVDALEAQEQTAPEILAHHCEHCGQLEKASTYWRESGNAALARPAYTEAISHFSAATALIERLDEPTPWREY
ncbi:MAG: adenylate/guanylate cyclase domain-containing protein, partial [Hyphomicrobium sp.]